MTTRRALRLALGIAIAVLFLWLILRRIEPEDVMRAFEGADVRWIAAALFAFAVGYACRIERWRLMLARANPALRWVDCAGPLVASFAANNVLPFRAGDVMRAFAFNDKLGTTSGAVLATVLVERLLDLLIIVCLLGAALALFGKSAGLAGVSGIALLAVAAVILLVLLYPNAVAPPAIALGRQLQRWAPRLGKKVTTEIDNSLGTLGHLANRSRMAVLIVWSAAVWLAEGCAFWASAMSLASVARPLAGWLALPVATLATLVPSTPGYVGTFDYFIVQAMSALDNSVSSATAYAFLVHALLWLPPTVVGGLYLLFKPGRQNDKKALVGGMETSR